MKSYSLLFILPLFIFACKNETSTTDNTHPTKEEVMKKRLEDAKNMVKEDLKPLEQEAGKKPKDFQMFEKYDLNKRIEKILGAEYENFKKDWVNETPLMFDVDIMYTSACNANCKANRYILVLDLVDNNINVYNYKFASGKSYEEGAVIGMPYKMSDEFEAIRKEQGL